MASYGCNNNQNVFVQSGRPTSRVLSQPGGKTSISIGGWSIEEQLRQKEIAKRKAEAVQPKPVIANDGEENEEQLQNIDPLPKENEETTKPSEAVSSNAFASGSNMNSGNVISARPSSRVLAPPGGHCSIRLF